MFCRCDNNKNNNNSGYIFAMIYIQNKSDKTKDMRVIGTST